MSALPPNLTELRGEPPDPNCLHCALAVSLAGFIAEHPSIEVDTVIGALVQVLAQYIASRAPAPADSVASANFALVDEVGAYLEVFRKAGKR